METAKLIITVISVIVAIALIAVVLLQSGKSAGLSGALTGGSSDSFLSKNKTKSWDAKMARATKWIAIAFIVLSFVVCLI